ncbi:MAG: lytic murein transglycosylase, partial [Rhodospirillaceae bacterium]|nr:lytic murein transglycosylase [Rhodospirillaceae bacterium]
MGKVLRQVGAFAAIAAVFTVANAASTLAGTPEVLARATAADRPAPGPNPPKGPASRPSFAAWIAGLKTEARTRRIGEATLTAALDGLRLNRRALELEARQPEFVTPVGAYVAALTGKKALAAGREKRRQHAALLARIEAAYGVP